MNSYECSSFETDVIGHGFAIFWVGCEVGRSLALAAFVVVALLGASSRCDRFCSFLYESDSTYKLGRVNWEYQKRVHSNAGQATEIGAFDGAAVKKSHL